MAILREYTAIEPQLWKNGRGLTRVLFDDAANHDDWTWRVSIAEISGVQPYSRYAGVRRGQFTLGPGDVIMTVNDKRLRLHPDDSVMFDGEDTVAADPSCPGFLDLNVMAHRDLWTPSLHIVDGGQASAHDRDVAIVTALEDRCTVDHRPMRRLDAVQLASAASMLTGRFVLARFTAA